ncbi:MAG: UvrABC system protein B [candidate division TM6 bacterium GW2011_GWF2_43_17]|nr:MAG: UvrABC system protein B [candidate division TM6 bacterium GW2011_GWF2_43_17]
MRERLKTRVEYDLEMIKEFGYCSGIENYSVHFDDRASGEAPYCLFDFFENFLLVIDESHIAIPQLRGMYAGDAARKKSLIEYGFRLPSARDNRPLKFEEIETYFSDVIFVSATPGDYEISKSQKVVEQIIRPTGLVDPEIHIHPREGQLDRLISEIRATSAQSFRTLITVMTKKQAEELARALEERQLRVCYLHHALKTPERTEILHKLRTGVFECLVGINLLREGLDLPEVALVAIMDADLESFLRDKRSLIQTIGRAARNSHSKVLFFADRITKSMQAALDETARRREKQMAYNKEHSITPTSTARSVTKSITNKVEFGKRAKPKKTATPILSQEAREQELKDLETKMQEAAARLDFEEAIRLRQRWFDLQKNI